MGNANGKPPCHSWGYAVDEPVAITQSQLDAALSRQQQQIERKLESITEAQAQVTAAAVAEIANKMQENTERQATNATALAVSLEASTIRSVEKCVTERMAPASRDSASTNTASERRRR